MNSVKENPIHWTNNVGLSACGSVDGRVTVREQDVTCEACRAHHNLKKPAKRIHTIRPSFGMVIATYVDEKMAHMEITAEKAKADFVDRADRTIKDLREKLSEWELMRNAAKKLSVDDFQPSRGA